MKNKNIKFYINLPGFKLGVVKEFTRSRSVLALWFWPLKRAFILREWLPKAIIIK